jgi:hypothetical protein
LWVSDQLQGAVLHLAADGTLLSRTPDLSFVDLLSVNPVNGSCLATTPWGYVVVYLGEEGTEQWRSAYEQVRDLAASSVDDTWWLGTEFHGLMHCFGSSGSYWIDWPGPGSPPTECYTLAVDPEDGSCWAIADGLVHVSADNIVLSVNEIVLPEGAAGVGGVLDMAVDSADPGCWLGFTGCVVRVATDGRATAIFPTAGPYPTDEYYLRVAADPTDGSCWALDRDDSERQTKLRHVNKEGTLRADLKPGFFPSSVSVNASDGSCWVSYRLWETQPGAVHLAPNGDFLTFLPNFGSAAVAANPTDGSLWGDGNMSLVHVSADGTQLASVATQTGVVSVSVNPTDGSCWAAANGSPIYGTLPAPRELPGGFPPSAPGEILHLSSTGEVLLHWTPDLAYGVSVNPTDGSCWVAASGGLAHVNASGAVLWHGLWGRSVSVNPTDGSCWVGTNGIVALVASDGTVLFQRFDLPGACTVAAVPGDGSCWVTVSPEYDNQGPSYVLHLAADGQELSRTLGFYHPLSVSVDPFDGSCWVADTQNAQVVHLVVEGVSDTIFSDVLRRFWAFDAINACVAAGIVQGYPDGTYHPDETVNRAQTAIYISRALAGGDESVPDGPPTATFPDVLTDHWAFKYIEYCYEQGVVTGYWDGYHPDERVDRAQMAVFVSRAMAGGDENVPDDPDSTPFFPDVPGDHWAYKYVEYCHDQGVAQGYWDGYHPEWAVDRGQMAVYVQRAFDLPM